MVCASGIATVDCRGHNVRNTAVVRIVCAALLLHVYKLTGREREGAVRLHVCTDICAHQCQAAVQVSV